LEGERSSDPRTFAPLEGHSYARLTTFRRSGHPVSTPVWFALVGGRVHVFTDIDSGKVKRIRNNPRVRLAPADFRGRPRGESVEAEARILEDAAEREAADRALREKYGWRYRLAQSAVRLSGNAARRAFLEVRPLPEGP
jgi:uncharacterized protein